MGDEAGRAIQEEWQRHDQLTLPTLREMGLDLVSIHLPKNYPVEYLHANRIRWQVVREMEEALGRVDLYVCPSHGGDNLLLTNLTGHPAVFLSNGFRSSDGTPTSITFNGRLYRETAMLAVAHAYQQATEFHLQRPPLRAASDADNQGARTRMTTEPYLDRRRRLMRTLEDGLILVRGGGPEGANPTFYYLTGIAEPSAALLLAPDGVRVGTGRKNPGPDYVRGHMARQVLFLPPTNPLAARWGEDCSATVENADTKQLGVDEIMSTSEMDEVLTVWLGRASALRIVRGFSPSLAGAADADTSFVQRVRSRFLGLRVHDATPVAHEMRRLKDHGEHEAIKRSIDVTHQALDAVVSRMADGLLEHELEAEIVRVYRAHGGTHAFEPIVGCGANALKLHYTSNDGPVQNGKLLLIDTGVSIQGYKSDITRTFPVGGKFSPRQREVYEVVLRAQEEAIAMCRPGVLIGDIHARSFEVIAEAGYDGTDYPHGIGHHLGLETHDVGDVHLPLEAGAVITIEPGVYVSGDDIGVRIEDDVLITEDGPRVLSAAIPKTVEDVERWVAQETA